MLNALIVTSMRIRTMSYFARCARRNHAKPSSVHIHTIQKRNTKVPSIGFCYPDVIVIDLVKLWRLRETGAWERAPRSGEVFPDAEAILWDALPVKFVATHRAFLQPSTRLLPLDIVMRVAHEIYAKA
jgi:hypothetical protein